MRYHIGKPLAGRRRTVLTGASLTVILIILGVLAGLLFIRETYYRNLRPVSDNIQRHYFTVEKGSSTKEIAADLKQQDLIRNAKAFEWYVRQKGSHTELQAGTYSLSQSFSSQEIVALMIEGKVNKNLLTILPGKRLDQLKRAFAEAGYDQATIDAALNPAQYSGHPALVGLPAGATLEGYLYPDSYEKVDGTPLSTIIKASLDEMAKKLTPDLIAGFQRQGLTTYQAITLGSIIEQEVSNPNDKPTVAQVFLLRLRKNMALGSDVTARYASILAGQDKTNYGIDSPYNTRKVTGLPPGPISNVTRQSLEAVAQPAATDYLFFVAGDDGTTYFSHTQAEHDALTKKYCIKLCAE